MEIIPEEWSVRLISPFLIGLSRDSLHTSRNTKLRKNLMRAENIKVAGYVCAGGGSDEDGNGGKDDDNDGDDDDDNGGDDDDNDGDDDDDGDDE